ncbi:hypothetical protein HDK77DRAFT_25885 [Phyllosticta capitalensis]
MTPTQAPPAQDSKQPNVFRRPTYPSKSATADSTRTAPSRCLQRMAAACHSPYNAGRCTRCPTGGESCARVVLTVRGMTSGPSLNSTLSRRGWRKCSRRKTSWESEVDVGSQEAMLMKFHTDLSPILWDVNGLAGLACESCVSSLDKTSRGLPMSTSLGWPSPVLCISTWRRVCVGGQRWRTDLDETYLCSKFISSAASQAEHSSGIDTSSVHLHVCHYWKLGLVEVSGNGWIGVYRPFD